MDLLKRCSGSNLCRFTKIFQRACFSFLAHGGWLRSPGADLERRTLANGRNLKFFNDRCTRNSFRGCHTTNVEMEFGRTAVGSCHDLPVAVQQRLSSLLDDIRKELKNVPTPDAVDMDKLDSLARYSFSEGGKLIRPKIVLLMSGASHLASHASVQTPDCKCSSKQDILDSQYKMALISEMIHTASLIHDDVIDESNERRGRPTAHQISGNKLAILSGNYILAKATQVLASLENPSIICLVSQVIEDLVRGEFMQLGSRDKEDERFAHYMAKTFKKTASLFAHTCKAVSVLANCSNAITEAAFEYGRHIGTAFQLIDDALDFVAQASVLGKPSAADLRLGIATAPVLFAARQHPLLTELILRRFSRPGDVQLAWELVLNSDGVAQTKKLAEMHSQEAIRCVEAFPNSKYKDALIKTAALQADRKK